MRHLRLLLIVSLCGRCFGSVPDSPEEMVTFLAERSAAFDVSEIAQFTHPDDLTRYKALRVRYARELEALPFRPSPELGFRSASELEAMDPAAVYEDMFKMIVDLMQKRDPEQFAALRGQAQSFRCTVIGTVSESSDILLVNHRVVGKDGALVGDVEVERLKRYNGRWMYTIASETFADIEGRLRKIEEGKRREGEPGATDNPDDAQRLREDH